MTELARTVVLLKQRRNYLLRRLQELPKGSLEAANLRVILRLTNVKIRELR